jgi:hypothetical protein
MPHERMNTFLNLKLSSKQNSCGTPHELEHAAGGAVVEALRYTTEGRGFDSRWCQ